MQLHPSTSNYVVLVKALLVVKSSCCSVLVHNKVHYGRVRLALSVTNCIIKGIHDLVTSLPKSSSRSLSFSILTRPSQAPLIYSRLPHVHESSLSAGNLASFLNYFITLKANARTSATTPATKDHPLGFMCLDKCESH